MLSTRATISISMKSSALLALAGLPTSPKLKLTVWPEPRRVLYAGLAMVMPTCPTAMVWLT